MMFDFDYMPFGLFGIFFMVVFWALIVWAVVVFIKWVAGLNQKRESRETAAREKSPLEILQERYAKGEITKKEYDQKKADLS